MNNMSLEQFTYTGSPWGRTAPGWTVFQQSNGVTPDAEFELKPYFQFKEMESNAADMVSGRHLPVKLVFAVNAKTGRRLVCQSLDAGARWYDQTRGKDYFAHVFTAKSSQNNFDDIEETFNPVAWLLSPSFQVEFPNEYRDKALKILHGECPNEPTPSLPTLNSIMEIEQNYDFADEQLFSRFCENEKAIHKVGKIISTMIHCYASKQNLSLFFDGTKSYSIDAMAVAVRLLPLSMRTNISFCTWLSAGELRTFPSVDELLFAGTLRRGETADHDIGLYGVLPQDGPDFGNSEEIETFKQMIDAGGILLDVSDFEELVFCWRVAVGQVIGSDEFRRAAKFASRYPAMMDRFSECVANIFAEHFSESEAVEMKVIGVIAWFEFGMSAFEELAWDFCCQCIASTDVFCNTYHILENQASKERFLATTADCAQGISNGLASFVNTMIDSRISMERHAAGMAQHEIYGLALEYCKIKDKVSNQILTLNVAESLNTVNRLFELAGAKVNGIVEVRKNLMYHQKLSELRNIKDIIELQEYVSDGLFDGKKIQKDIVDTLKPKNVYECVEMCNMFNEIGLHGEEMVCEMWMKDRNELQRLRNELNNLREFRRKTGQKTAYLMRMLLFGLAIILGFLVGRRFCSKSIPSPDNSVKATEEIGIETLNINAHGETGALAETMALKHFAEGEGALEPSAEGKGVLEPPVDGQGTVEPPTEGEGALEPLLEGKGAVEPPAEGRGALDSPTEGEDTVDSPTEGEGTVESPAEGESALEPPVERKGTLEPPVEGEDKVELPAEGEDD